MEEINTYEDAFYELAYLTYRMIEGDDVLNEVNELLYSFGLIDKYGEWVE